MPIPNLFLAFFYVKIFEEEPKKKNIYDSPWSSFAVTLIDVRQSIYLSGKKKIFTTQLIIYFGGAKMHDLKLNFLLNNSCATTYKRIYKFTIYMYKRFSNYT